MDAFWFCAYTPVEILEAAGFKPRRLFGEIQNLEDADHLLHPAFCPYVRALLVEGMHIREPHLAIFVNSCDAMRRLFDAWKSYCNSELALMLDLPRRGDSCGMQVMVKSLAKLARELESFLGREITFQNLQESIASRAELRRKIAVATKGMAGSELIRLVQRAQQTSSREFLHKENVLERGRGVPLVLTGNLLNVEGLVRVIEEHGGYIVAADLCNGERPFLVESEARGSNRDELLFSLARQYLSRRHCARMLEMEERNAQLKNLITSRGARGVIYASLKFCDTYIYDYPQLKRFLDGEGIPVLRLESDYQDGHAGQLSTRIEAFVEMLEEAPVVSY